MATQEGEAQRAVVVGYDGRDPSSRALDEAVTYAQEAGAKVVAVVVGHIDVAVGSDPYALGGVGYEYVAPIPEGGPLELQPLLAAARERLEASSATGEAVWSLGDPASEILRVAEETHAERIFVGHHHHSALGRFFGTDVDARIEDEAGCEVVVMR